MKHTIVVGLQHGDEGKGKIVDYLAEKHFNHVVRFNGGPNAGHTVYVKGEKFVTHMVPTGVLAGKRGYIGPGCVINPVELLQEIEYLENKGIQVAGKLFIDDNVNMILPWHIEADIQAEKTNPVGSTKKGIAPCYADKYGRKGVNLLNYTNFGIPGIYRAAIGTIRRKYSEHVGEMLRNLKEPILFEGAQGTQLDVDSSDYPNVTSSHCTAPYAMIGSGMGYIKDPEIIGVIKPYLTKVGTGSFPSSIEGEDVAEHIRTKGKEFGATTGRPRKIGWNNMVELVSAAKINGVTQIALLKNDILNKDSEMQSFGVNVDSNYVKTFQCWDNVGDNTFLIYKMYLERELNVPITFVGNGPNRDDLLTYGVKHD